MYSKYKIVPFCPYHFVHTILSNTILSVYHFFHTILSVPFCPLPFCTVTPVGHCSLLAISRERCVFHVDRVWTSTMGEGVRPMWTEGRGVKNMIFFGRHKWMAPYRHNKNGL